MQHQILLTLFEENFVTARKENYALVPGSLRVAK